MLFTIQFVTKYLSLCQVILGVINRLIIRMEAFFNHLLQFETLSKHEIELIKANVYCKNIAAKTNILEPGQISKRLGFVLSGVIRIFYYDDNGNEVIHCFHNENHFIGDLESYQSSMATERYIQTITDCTVVFFNKENDEYLNKTLDKWPILVRKLTESALMAKINNMKNLVHADAKTKYLEFLKKHADIVQRIPLGDLASYLGIAQPSLSRIRKSIII